MNKKDKLKKMTDKLLADQDDRDLWEVLIEVLSEDEVAAILAAVEEDESKLVGLNANLQAKLDSLLASDQDEWQAIVDREIALVKNS